MTLGGENEFSYSLLVPPNLQRGKSYPLIVTLHGARGNIEAPIRWWQAMAEARGYFVCAPKSRGQSWTVGDQSHVHRIVQEVLRDSPVDRKRVLLTGVSDGGTYSYVLGFERPDLYGALAPIAGVLPRFYADLATTPKLPICIVHGSADEVFPVGSAREAAERLKSAKYNVTYFEVARASHGFLKAKAGDVLDWFDALSTAPTPEKKKEQRLRLRAEEFHNAELLCNFQRMASMMRSRSGGVTAETLEDSLGRYRQLSSETLKVEMAGDNATVEVFKRYGSPFTSRTGRTVEKWVWKDEDWFLEW